MQEFLFFFLPDKPELVMNEIFLKIFVKETHYFICYLKKLLSLCGIHIFSYKECNSNWFSFSPSRIWRKMLNKSESRIGKTKQY